MTRSLDAARSRAEQRVQRFVEAAFELIDERGATEFTIQEVVERSKQSLRGFYEYFEAKDELVLALFEETVREAGDHIRAPFVQPAPFGHITAACCCRGGDHSRLFRGRSTRFAACWAVCRFEQLPVLRSLTHSSCNTATTSTSIRTDGRLQP